MLHYFIPIKLLTFITLLPWLSSAHSTDHMKLPSVSPLLYAPPPSFVTKDALGEFVLSAYACLRFYMSFAGLSSTHMSFVQHAAAMAVPSSVQARIHVRQSLYPVLDAPASLPRTTLSQLCSAIDQSPSPLKNSRAPTSLCFCEGLLTYDVALTMSMPTSTATRLATRLNSYILLGTPACISVRVSLHIQYFYRSSK